MWTRGFRLNTSSPYDSSKDVASTQAILPTADLKALYDFTLDCKACQSKLAAAQADLTNERAKAAILTRERNAKPSE